MNTAIGPLPPLIVFDRVTKRYGGKAVIEELSFVIARNEFVVLTGPAGSGKSTVMRLIAALERPTSGAISVAGEPLAEIRRRTLPHLRRSIGIVPQDLLLLDDRSVLENVALPVVAAGFSWSEARSRATTALQRVGLEKTDSGTLPVRLSGSTCQRVALARALVNRPALLLIDEPLAHLDDASSETVIKLLEQFVGAGVTVMLAAQNLSRLPARTRIIGLGGFATE
jgi:cell division transport system ATP-binding protein